MSYLYDVAIELNDRSIFIDWNNDSGWMQTYATELLAANSIALLPRDKTPLPLVSVQLGNGKRWIIFTRNFGILGIENQVKVYCIGWQKDGEKQLIWIYPNGTIECAEQPSFWKLFI